MNLKRTFAATVATGAVALMAFGGSPVSTAFTTSGTGAVSAQTATVSGFFENLNIALPANAIPGDTVTQAVKYHNNGSNPMALTITLGHAVTSGSNAAALAQKATLTIPGVGTFQLSQIPTSGTFSLGSVAPGQEFSQNVTLTLPPTADNTVSGASYSLPFTLTATATH
jgi:hypothetical protein